MASGSRREIAFGGWPSAISAERILAGALRLGLPQVDRGDVYWLEGRPGEGGRQVVVCGRPGVEPRDVVPAGVNVRTLVHEYGGGDYGVRDGVLVYADFADQRVHRVATSGGTPVPITPAGQRYADFEWSPDGRWLVAVEERPRDPDEPENRLVALRVDREAIGAPVEVAAGHDFVSFPRFSADGRRLAYTAWEHPRMPWDGTRLFVQDFGADGPEGEPVCVAGGDAESIFQPAFSPDGALGFVSDRSGWWNLYTLGPDLSPDDAPRPLCPSESEFGLPQWVFGMSTWGWVGARTILCTVTEAGRSRLVRLDLSDAGPAARRDLELPLESIVNLRVDGATVCFVGAAGGSPSAIHHYDLETGELSVLRSSVGPEGRLEPEEISLPEPIEFPTGDGQTAHAFYYAPRSPVAIGPPDERPPLLVKSHGGPTSATHPVLNPAIQYWTSRGIAVVDVNYGGSTGYGRAYRERLRGRWGIVDVEDCVNAARFLADSGRVDPARLAISGGSAGGYTTLCALTFHDVFAAGASHYGIGDLEALARDTHKFESRYLDGLVGPYPEAAERYRERSPIHFTEQLSCPVIFFQGLEDRVVPPNQAEAMVAALAKQGIRHAHVTFAGEQHGFRKAENIKTALEGELYFYSQIFGFDVDVRPDGVEIVG